jgi:2-dehydro-3-deoxy-D-arabinonate dehydratase
VADLTAVEPGLDDALELVLDCRATGRGVVETVGALLPRAPRTLSLAALEREGWLLTPFDAPEVWAAGVTFERSRVARDHETSLAAGDAGTFYDWVYTAERPEIFFKATAARVVGPGRPIGVRHDSRWSVPEPELCVVVDADGVPLGYIVGNDVSSRDIEGQNPLYLPQAKIFRGACALGPVLVPAEALPDPYALTIRMTIHRGGRTAFEGEVPVSNLKRRIEDLIDWLCRDNVILPGTVLMTGVGIVPPDDYSLEDGDRVDIEIGPLGTLRNPVVRL